MLIDELVEKLTHKIDKLDGRWRNRVWLKTEGVDPDTALKLAIPLLFQCIARKDTLVASSIKIGNSIRRFYKLPDVTEASLHSGLLIVETFIEAKVLRYYETNSGSNKHASYYIQVDSWPKWKTLKDLIVADEEKLPFDGWPQKNTDWSCGYSDSGLPLIRDAHRSALSAVSVDTHEVLFGAVNKLQSTPYRVNQSLYKVWKQLRVEARDKKFTGPSPFKFVGERNKQRAASYIIEADTIEMMVDRLIGEDIHHTYNCDFRGRIYNTTVFLEEQASDQAKALLQYSNSSPLGETGLLWLMIHTANVWGNDKVSLEKRIAFVEDNMDQYILWGMDPFNNRGWMEADKAWSFLMCCIEFAEIAAWCENGMAQEAFPSHVICYIDGSNNGIQHLVAMSRDHEAAPYVNLTKTVGDDPIPGDIYMYIAGKVWEKISKLVEATPKDVVEEYPSIKEKFFQITMSIDTCKTKQEKQDLYDTLNTYKDSIGDSKVIAQYAPLFWNQFKDDPKLQRKMVKRNVMTIGYGATKGGMGQQAREDTPDMHDDCRWIPGGWHYWFGALVFDTCYEYLDGPAMMLRMFRELAESENQKDLMLAYKTPHTGFPVVQNYRKSKAKRADVLFLGSRIQLNYVAHEEKSLDKSKQLSSTAPNVTHSLDAAHLTMVVYNTPFEVTTIHDSFGCHAGDMGELFNITREQFLLLYQENPLLDILGQVSCDHLMPNLKEWTPDSIMDSDFAFC
jgi:DNA-directed RNA polymerase